MTMKKKEDEAVQDLNLPGARRVPEAYFVFLFHIRTLVVGVSMDDS